MFKVALSLAIVLVKAETLFGIDMVDVGQPVISLPTPQQQVQTGKGYAV
jgi:hypothetical protein